MSTTVIKGPAQIEWGGLKFISQGEITVTHNPESFDVATDAHGHLEERLKSRTVTVAFTPSGQWVGEAITSIFAAAGRVPGTTILNGPLVIKPFISAQPVITYARAGMTGLPGLMLSASKTLFGQLTFTCLAAVDSTTGCEASSGAFSAPVSTFDNPNILTEPWTGTWGATTTPDPEDDGAIIDLETEDGWTLNTEITTDMCRADSVGIVDILQTSCKVTATCKPVGWTEAQFLNFAGHMQATQAVLPGESFGGKNLTTGLAEKRSLFLTSRTGYVITLANCGVRAGTMAWGSSANRFGGLTFTGIRKFTSGVMQGLLGFSSPDDP